MNILHITVHMGGGVGHAISDLVLWDKQNNHKIVVLQKPEKRQYIKKCEENSIYIDEEPAMECIENLMCHSDIVIVHWWHHPVMCKFLYDFPDIPVRLVLWSHISGCSYPALTYQFANRFSKIFLTSEYSLENPYWSEMERKEIKDKSSIVYGLGQLTKMEQKLGYNIKDNTVKIGYAGTLAKSKIHPEFPTICKKILEDVPNAEFYLLGDCESGEWIRKQVNTLGIADKTHFEGFVDNVNEWLIRFDIFGYPLNPYHFGTTENSILEAMSVGLPVVLLNQATEKYIVTQNEDGILADGVDGYVSSVVQLVQNEKLRKKLGLTAAHNVQKKFSFETNLEHFQKMVKETASLQPQKIGFANIMGNSPFNWFLSAVHSEDRMILEKHQYDKMQPILLEKSKSSILHFAISYPTDDKLQEYKKEVENYYGTI